MLPVRAGLLAPLGAPLHDPAGRRDRACAGVGGPASTCAAGRARRTLPGVAPGRPARPAVVAQDPQPPRTRTRTRTRTTDRCDRSRGGQPTRPPTVLHRDVAARRPRNRRYIKKTIPPPPDPAWHQFVREFADEHGWGINVTERTQRMLLGMPDTSGAAIRASDVLPMSRIRHPVRRPGGEPVRRGIAWVSPVPVADSAGHEHGGHAELHAELRGHDIGDRAAVVAPRIPRRLLGESNEDGRDARRVGVVPPHYLLGELARPLHVDARRGRGRSPRSAGRSRPPRA